MPIALPRTATVAGEDFRLCVSFAQTMKDKHQANEFNEQNAKRRPDQIYLDTLNGKLCEVAICDVLNSQYDLALAPDFRIIGRNRRDLVDFSIGRFRVSVKGTKVGNRLLLLHRGQYRTYQTDGAFPTHYVLCNVSAHDEKGVVTIVGATEACDFYAGSADLPFGPGLVQGTNATYGRLGTPMGRSGTLFQADNLVLDKSHLKSDLDLIVPVELRKARNR